jgi:adenosylcobinamide kinase/adenosylcobinamide-phosphate guanylyltransferase
MLTVLLGGARSGKSALAVRIGERHGGDVIYIATSPRIQGDDDLDDRIDAHRAERPATWRTIEEELDLAGAIAAADAGLVIVDCLTVWLGNLLHHGYDETAVTTACLAALDTARARSGDTVAITNEVGLGIIPANELARRYRDQLGRINQRWVAASDRSYLMVAGRALALTDPGTEWA